MTPLQTWVKKRGRGALSHIQREAIRMGSDLSWTTIIRAHRHGGVKLETAKLISKICHKLDKGKPVPPLSMMEPCDPPPDPKPKPKPKKKASARKKTK